MGRIYNVSPHLLFDVHTCATRGWSRHVIGYTSISDAIKAKAGQAFHAATAVFLDPDTSYNIQPAQRNFKAVAALHDVYDAAWQIVPAEQMEPSLTPDNIERVFRRWMETHPPISMPWRRVESVETAFVSRRWGVLVNPPTLVELPDEATAQRWLADGFDVIQLIIRPDAVVEDINGFLRYVDTKTTGWRISDESWSRGMRLNAQTQLYADGMVQKYGARAMLGGWINAVELRKLPGSSEPKLKKDGTPAKERLCADHGLPYAQCGNEHAKMAMLECLTSPERVAIAVEDAKRGALQFVKLMQLHEAYLRDPNSLVMDNGSANGELVNYPIGNIPMEGTYTNGCRFCPAAQWCDETARNVSVIDSYMKYLPWPVEPGKRL